MSQGILTQKEKFFDRWAPNYDILFTTVIYQAIHKRLLEYVSLSPQAQILDLGCGTGRFLDRLASEFPKLQGIGLDLSEEMLHRAKLRNRFPDRLQFQQGEASQLPCADQSFDAVFNTFSFLHYPEPQRVFREVHRVLRPQGQFYWVDPLMGDAFSRLRLAGNPIHFYDRSQREALGAAVGLRCQQHVHLLGPALLTQFERSGI
jgi:ubiquinone/menaquinone biosynthesis C-methylase UbiE